MKKILMLMVIFLTMLVFATFAMANTDVPVILMPNGIEVHESLVKNQGGKVYVDFETFNNFDHVIAFSDFGGSLSWTPEKGYSPSEKTSIALLLQDNFNGKVIVAVNKTTGEVLVEDWRAERNVSTSLDVIIEDGKVYLPLQATVNLLGATVDYGLGDNIINIK